MIDTGEYISLLLEAMGEDARNRVRMLAKEYEEFAPLQDLFHYEEEEE